VIVISCEGVPFSDAPEWALSQKGGRLVVITGAVTGCISADKKELLPLDVLTTTSFFNIVPLNCKLL
jgi:hypothetical protein